MIWIKIIELYELRLNLELLILPQVKLATTVWDSLGFCYLYIYICIYKVHLVQFYGFENRKTVSKKIYGFENENRKQKTLRF